MGCLKLRHNRLLPDPFQFTILSHPIIRRYIIWVSEIVCTLQIVTLTYCLMALRRSCPPPGRTQRHSSWRSSGTAHTNSTACRSYQHKPKTKPTLISHMTWMLGHILKKQSWGKINVSYDLHITLSRLWTCHCYLYSCYGIFSGQCL